MRTGHAPVTGAGHAPERVSEALPEHCLGVNVGATLANGGLTLIALPGRVAFQVRPLGATSDGSELSQGLTLRYLTTTNGGSEKIPPCRTNRQGIAPRYGRKACPSHVPETFPPHQPNFRHVSARGLQYFCIPPPKTCAGSLPGTSADFPADLQRLIRPTVICRKKPSTRGLVEPSPRCNGSGLELPG